MIGVWWEVLRCFFQNFDSPPTVKEFLRWLRFEKLIAVSSSGDPVHIGFDVNLFFLYKFVSVVS